MTRVRIKQVLHHNLQVTNGKRKLSRLSVKPRVESPYMGRQPLCRGLLAPNVLGLQSENWETRSLHETPWEEYSCLQRAGYGRVAQGEQDPGVSGLCGYLISRCGGCMPTASTDVCAVTIRSVSTPMWVGWAELWALAGKKEVPLTRAGCAVALCLQQLWTDGGGSWVKSFSCSVMSCFLRCLFLM